MRTEELLTCPVCWEPFNLVKNVPYALWCGHTLCKTCILSLPWSSIKFPRLPIHLPLFISCPWCQLLFCRLVWKGKLRFASKNYFLLWFLESAKGNQSYNQISSNSGEHGQRFLQPSNTISASQNVSITSSMGNFQDSLQGSLCDSQAISHVLRRWKVCASMVRTLAFLIQLTVKFPVVVMLMLIAMYVIMASVTILIVHLSITFLFALPSFLVLYFSHPILEWLLREILLEILVN